MLLLNGKQFIPTSNDPDQKIQRNHYKESVKAIRDKYSQGGRLHMITLVRRKEQKRNASGQLEETAPLVFPAKAYAEIQFSLNDDKMREKIGGSVETWAYSKNRPIIKNAGEQFEPSPKSLKFISHSQGYDMDREMDLIYFLLYKSPRVYYAPAIAQGKAKKGDLIVDDRQQRAKDKVSKERAELKLKNAIMAPDMSFPLHSDENLRTVAAAWGIDGAMDRFESADELRIKLEHSVKEGEKTKKTSGAGKGFDDFFKLIEFDDSVRARTMMMYALDNGIVTKDDSAQKYLYSSGSVLLTVPDNKKYSPFDYLAGYLLNEVNKKEWDRFRKEVISTEYLEMVAYGDLKWLARFDDIPLSHKSAAELREEIAKIYCG